MIIPPYCCKLMAHKKEYVISAIFALTNPKILIKEAAMLIMPLILALGGLVGLWLGLRRSVRGYQDELGFHAGSEPILHDGIIDALTASFRDQRPAPPARRQCADETLFENFDS